MSSNPLYPDGATPKKIAEPLEPKPFERRQPRTPWTDKGAIPPLPPYDNERNERKESA